MGALKSIGDKLSDFTGWVKEQLEDEAIRRSIAEDLGLDVPATVPKADLPADKLDSISKYKKQANPDKEAFITLVGDVRAVYEAVRSFIGAFGVTNATVINELTYRLFDLLALNYVRLYLPTLFFVSQALGALVEDSGELVEEEIEAWRFLKTLGKAFVFAVSPLYYLTQTFSAKDEARAKYVSERIFPQLAAVFAWRDFKEILLGWDNPDALSAKTLGIKDLPGFARKLKAPGDPVTQYLKDHALGQDELTQLNVYDVSGPPNATLRTGLVAKLNAALKDAALFDATRFAKVKLSAQLKKQAADKPTGDALILVNKKLLEAAYPDELSLSPKPLADQIAGRMLTVGFPTATKPTPGSDIAGSVDFTLGLVPATHAKPGLMIGVGGQGAMEIDVSERWRFRVQASAQPAFTLFVDPTAPKISATGPIALPLNVALVSVPGPNDVTFALPDADGTRLEIGELDFSFSFDGTNGGVKAEARRCALVLQTKDQDGFLAKVLPTEGLRVPFSFGVGYSTDRHFYTDGGIEWPTGHKTNSSGIPAPAAPAGGAPSATPRLIAREVPTTPTLAPSSVPPLSTAPKPELGMKLQIPIGKALISVRLDRITVGLAPSENSASATAVVEASISFTAKLGPVAVNIDRIGVENRIGFPETGGNLGFADISLGLKAPTGAGIVIDSPFVSGGGFLAFDREHGQYAGVVQLTIKNFATITALGLVTTRLPNGAKGFSFVILITVQDFQPIVLGMGFTLTGIGGLLAINRTANEEYLREGIKNGTLNNILFPKDAITNAPAILGTLNNAFPTQEGSFLFGPALQIRWGTPPILTLNLGLVLELGKRHRLLILGVVTAIMPTEKHDLLRLNMNALGVIDFDQSSISLDAVLFDSRLVGKFPITGAMALRLNWGDAPLFALSIGGFHPAFKPPPALPSLDRLAITFANSDDFKLRLDGYFAITSNTVQFGAHVDLFAGVAGFSIVGHLGFDVLIQFDPFSFIADLCALIQLKRGSHNLLKCELVGELSGPRPLHVHGKVSFEILWCEFTKSFDRTLISGDPPPKPAPVVVLSQLQTALKDPRNWNGQLAQGARRAVSLREPTASTQIALHPLGKLSVKQNVVPLNLPIARFGNTTPADARLFEIKRVTLNSKEVGFDPVQDTFAPAQFLELNDEAKLNAPSFENMNAGVTLSSKEFLLPTNDLDLVEDPNLEYETLIIDKTKTEPVKDKAAQVSPSVLTQYLFLGAAGRSGLRRSLATRYEPAAPKNTIAAQRWEIVSTEDGGAQAVGALPAGKEVSYAEAFGVLNKTKRENPERGKELRLQRVAIRDHRG